MSEILRDGPRTGLGECPLVLGECVQGCLRHTQHFLITSPIDLFSWAEFTPDLSKQEVLVEPADRWKALQGVKRYLTDAGLPSGGSLRITTPLAPGCGFGTSTADIAASVRAAAAAWGRIATPDQISAIAISIEPSDGSMFTGTVAYDHRRGQLLEQLGDLPPFHSVVVFSEGTIDTLEFDEFRRHHRYSVEDERALRRAWEMVRYATARQDLSVLGEAATISARINQELLHKPFFGAICEFASKTGTAGVMAAHSGTVLAILLDPMEPGYSKRLDATRAFVRSLAPNSWLETANRQLLRERKWCPESRLPGDPPRRRTRSTCID